MKSSSLRWFLILMLMSFSFEHCAWAAWREALIASRFGFNSLQALPVAVFQIPDARYMRLWMGANMYLESDNGFVYKSDNVPKVSAFNSYSIYVDSQGMSDHFYCALPSGIYSDRRRTFGETNPRKISASNMDFACDYISVVKWNGGTHLAFYDKIGKALKYATLSVNPWEEKSWVVRTIDADGDTGMFAVLKLDSDGDAHIVYYSGSTQMIKYARVSGNEVLVENVAPVSNNENTPSIAIDSKGTPHISYYVLNKGLYYASKVESGWQSYNVDQGGGAGYFSSIAISTGDTVNIAYYDVLCRQLSIAKKTTGNWEIERINPSNNECAFGKWHFNEKKEACWSYDSWLTNVHACRAIGIPPERYAISLVMDENNLPNIVYTDFRAEKVIYTAKKGTLPDLDLRRANFRRGILDIDNTPPATRLNMSRNGYYDDEAGGWFFPEGSPLAFISEDVPGELREDVSGLETVYYSVNSDIRTCFSKAHADGALFPVMSSLTWSNGGCGVGSNSDVFLPEGKYDLSYAAVDKEGNYEAIVSTKIYVDGTPPITKAVANGKNLTSSSVSIKSGRKIQLQAEDPVRNNAASGVAYIKYALDPSPQIEEYEDESSVFSGYQGGISPAKGRHTLVYYSVDKVGNYEPRKTMLLEVN